jgi:hypothetical protein
LQGTVTGVGIKLLERLSYLASALEIEGAFELTDDLQGAIQVIDLLFDVAGLHRTDGPSEGGDSAVVEHYDQADRRGALYGVLAVCVSWVFHPVFWGLRALS